MSHGIRSNYAGVYEPVFKLDVDAAKKRDDWSVTNAFEAQPYMEFGVHTDKDFHVTRMERTLKTYMQ